MKGQLFSSDLIAAISIFLVLISLMTFSYSQILDSHQRDLQRKGLELDGMKFAENLLRTKGLPENWEDLSDPIVLGLSSGNNNILDNSKVDKFFSLEYDSIKNISKIGSDFELKFVNSGKTKGSSPNSAVENVIFLRRFALYNNSMERIELKLWNQ